ncbi:MAG: sigma-70 family RNA polymerase sigma factor [Bacteroidales bacterium]|nr:sigma-70 family RNA polymerase sigma factor [Bacteroidales bacterium]
MENAEIRWLKARDGNKDAFESLFKSFYPGLCFYAYHLTNDSFLAEEIVQDVFTKLWKEREKIRIRESIRSYLYKSVHNSAINALISKKANKNLIHKVLSSEEWSRLIENYESNTFLIELIEAEDTEKVIRNAIDKLPPQCREIFMNFSPLLGQK